MLENFKNIFVGESKSVLFKILSWVAFVVLIYSIIYTAIYAINAVRGWNYGGYPSYPTSVTISGEGKVVAIKDIATVSFNVYGEDKDVSVAQKLANEKMDAVMSSLAKLGVEKKDINTTYYDVSPTYEYYEQAACIKYPCPPVIYKEPTIKGYKVTQSVTVKVRDLAKVGDIIAALGASKVDNISGPSFDIDDKAKLVESAKLKAVADAKAKADNLAKTLGLRVVKVAGVSYDNSDYNNPYTTMMDAGMAYREVKAQAVNTTVNLPVGEGEIVQNVSVTFEFK